MSVYPVGTPTAFEFPGQIPLAKWRFPNDFTTLLSGTAGTVSARWRTDPVAKPTASSMYVDGYDINFQNATWRDYPILYIVEANPPTFGPARGQIRNTATFSTLLHPPSIDTAPDAYGAPLCNASTSFSYSTPSSPYVCGVANWAAGDSGALALVTAGTSPANGPFAVDCGSGPNRVLIAHVSLYGPGDTSTAPTLNGASPFHTSQVQMQAAPVGVQQYETATTKLWVWVNPPAGSANLAIDWGLGRFRGILAVSAYAGVFQANPLGQLVTSATSGGSPVVITPSSTWSLTTSSNTPIDTYWVSDLTCYSNPSPALTSGAGTQFGNLQVAGLVSGSFVDGAGTGSPVTTSWSLASAQAAVVRILVLSWDGTTPTPTPVAIPARLATIVG